MAINRNQVQKELLLAMEALEGIKKKGAIDPKSPNSKPTKQQQKLFDDIGKKKYRIVRAGNQSGKSTVCAREMAWVATETHPTWTRPVEWGSGPLTLLLAGQDRKSMEVELWGNKLCSYLNMEEWRIVRQGASISFAEHLLTGNKIVFVSHSDGSDKTRRHMQGYVAHYVWVDEMPMSIGVFEELQRRIQAREGYMLCSFTPKVRNEALRRHIDELCKTTQAALYRLSMMDNPLYAKRKKELMAELSSLPEAYRNTVLYGDWYTGEFAVYQWEDKMVEPIPETYHPSWRHVQSVDPALKSKMGHLIFAENPHTSTWHLIEDQYIQDIYHPEDILQECIKRSAGVRIIRRVTDVAPWFQETASRKKFPYLIPFNKTQRKDELIKGLQAALSGGKVKISPHCTNFIDEITGCQWSETSDKIVNGQSYHCLDSAQYFVDLMPKPEPGAMSHGWEIDLRMANTKRKEEKAATAKMTKMSINKRTTRPILGWGRRSLIVN